MCQIELKIKEKVAHNCVRLVLALPIFTVRASYRHAVRNSPVDCYRHRYLPLSIEKAAHNCVRLVLALPIFTASHPATIVGVNELNFCVRDGNRWTLITINTNSFGWDITHHLYVKERLLSNSIKIIALANSLVNTFFHIP